MTPSESRTAAPLVVNGWAIFAHPIFLNQIEALVEEVEARKTRDPANYQKKNCTKRLAAIFKLISENIPSDPDGAPFRQGDTLGEGRKHWFRAKFFQQYRLFFRFDEVARIIVLAWGNDEATLRACGSRTDAYATFRSMLADGNPPDDFASLLKAAKASAERFRSAVEAAGDR
ncbi:MAG: toxin [Proteobacteria bacterium]|nr:toxin [Pseudomonadota bacterium]